MMLHSVTSVVLVLVLFLVCLLAVYSGLPNLWVRLFHQRAVRNILSSKRMDNHVVLTFDDGPDRNYTPQLLDALKQVGIRASFFVIASKAVQRPEIVQRMIAEGHEVQIHGYRHLMVPFLGPRATIHQVAGASAVIEKKLGIQTRWYRPTWGLCNLVTLFSKRCATHQLVTWSVMVGDWKRTPSEILLKRILNKLHPGAIIVLHDSDETFGADEGAPRSVIELMPLLAKAVHEQGYEFTTLSEALPL